MTKPDIITSPTSSSSAATSSNGSNRNPRLKENDELDEMEKNNVEEGGISQNGATNSRQNILNPTKTARKNNPNKNDTISWIRRPCLWVAIGIKWLPVAFISAVIAWSYYAFVVVVCFITVENLAEKIFYLIFYHIILVIFVWSYFMTIFAPRCEAPSNWKLTPAMAERLNKAASEEEWKNLLELFVVEMEISVMQRSVQGAIRYCDKCEAVKPDRSHHCSVCGMCVLKMDHHCPWVNNCVAFNNYKFFLLFLGYALIYCIYLAACVFRYFVLFWTDGLKNTGASEGSGKFHILFLFFVSVMFCISVSSLFWYHVYLVLRNRSTLEQFRAPYFAGGPDEGGWSLGKRNNFQEVFGDRKLFWFLPLPTMIGDGLTYPTRLSANNIEATYQSTSLRQPMAHASPAANAVRGRSQDIGYIDEDSSISCNLNNGGVPITTTTNHPRNTEVVMNLDERVQVKVSALPKNDLMQLQ